MKPAKAEEAMVERTENGDKEKKKRRRSNRRSKNPAVSSQPNEVQREASSVRNGGKVKECDQSPPTSSFSKQHVPDSNSLRESEPSRASDVAFNSLPSMHINKLSGLVDSVKLETHVISEDPGERVLSKSCPDTLVSHGRYVKEDLSFLQFEDDQKSRMYASHWSMDAVHEALERGRAFMASFRVNAHNRNEAYCSIEGVQTDVLINGIVAQNRAVEGDVVVIKLDPISMWPRMKGFISYNPSQPASCNVSSNPMDFTHLDFKVNCRGDGKDDATEGEASQGDCLAAEVSHLEFDGHVSCYEDQYQLSTFHSFGWEKEYRMRVRKLSSSVTSSPSKRPTGSVVAIIKNSLRRDSIVGFLNVKQWLRYRALGGTVWKKHMFPPSVGEYIQLLPIDPRFPKMVVAQRDLTENIQKRLENGDSTVEKELVAAQISGWDESSSCPQACIVQVFGRGSQLEAQIDAILYQNSLCCSDFSPECISCLPRVPWEFPQVEIKHRNDLRRQCVFTIDPSTATDLDDALSVERLSNGIYRIGIHIADVSYFVLPDTALDLEARFRSTTVHMLQRKLPMLPPSLSENIASLNSGNDRLAFSMLLDINGSGDVVDWWIGRTLINSCCKLSYENVQGIIDGNISMENLKAMEKGLPQLHGSFEWCDVIKSIKSLHYMSKLLRQKRFENGALRLESSKLVFLFDEEGAPYDTRLCVKEDSNFLVEEYMLLANRTAAEIISRAFPDSALLRRHPEPNMRKLKEFEAFCLKHGLEPDTSSSGRFHDSLEQIREKLKEDSVFLNILINYATKPMQLASYFCSGDFKEKASDWNHYALALPLYTHFTSPLRRYPDIVVHRTLAAAIEAEDLYNQHRRMSSRGNHSEVSARCFTGFYFDRGAAESIEGKEALAAAALRHGIPSIQTLPDIVAYCNEKKLACRHVRDACDKLYGWLLLKRKWALLAEARVLGLGPRFMSIYIPKLAIERRIYYDDVEGLRVEWLDATSTLVLNKRSKKKGANGHYRAIEEMAYIVNPYDLSIKSNHERETFSKSTVMSSDFMEESVPASPKEEVEPGVFPLTLQLLSNVPVALHAIGGDDGPVDIGVRLYMSSYLK